MVITGIVNIWVSVIVTFKRNTTLTIHKIIATHIERNLIDITPSHVYFDGRNVRSRLHGKHFITPSFRANVEWRETIGEYYKIFRRSVFRSFVIYNNTFFKYLFSISLHNQFVIQNDNRWSLLPYWQIELMEYLPCNRTRRLRGNANEFFL
jgi:hypothetical protein